MKNDMSRAEFYRNALVGIEAQRRDLDRLAATVTRELERTTATTKPKKNGAPYKWTPAQREAVSERMRRYWKKRRRRERQQQATA
jgi:hypothetical protein